jgi:hypothetical protein
MDADGEVEDQIRDLLAEADAAGVHVRGAYDITTTAGDRYEVSITEVATK